jgi:hypothetical protein
MKKDELLAFTRKILESSSMIKAAVALNQLIALLEEQGASEIDVDLVKMMARSIPEMKELAKQGAFTVEDVVIAERRAQERKAREEDARRYGRC